MSKNHFLTLLSTNLFLSLKSFISLYRLYFIEIIHWISRSSSWRNPKRGFPYSIEKLELSFPAIAVEHFSPFEQNTRFFSSFIWNSNVNNKTIWYFIFHFHWLFMIISFIFFKKNNLFFAQSFIHYLLLDGSSLGHGGVWGGLAEFFFFFFKLNYDS